MSEFLEPHQFSIIKIENMIQLMENSIFPPGQNITMRCYHVKLGADAPKLCLLVLPWQE